TEIEFNWGPVDRSQQGSMDDALDRSEEAIAAAAGSAPPAAPAALLDGEVALANSRAYADGYNSGKAGGRIGANPFAHQPGSEQYTRWRDGWSDGNGDYQAKNGLTDRVAQAPTTDTSMPAETEQTSSAPPPF